MAHVSSEQDERASLAVYEVGISGEVKGWSQAATKLLGFSPEEVIGHYVTELFEAAASSTSALTLEEAKRDGKSEAIGQVTRKDGSRFWAHEVTLPINDEFGKTIGFSRVIRDVTLAKRAEEERDRIFTLSADLICVAGFDGFFKRVNPAWSRLLGYPEFELLNKPYFSFVHPDDLAATHQEADANSIGAGDAVIQTFQNRYRRSDGSYVWLDWKVHSIVEDQLIYGVARDVTEQKATSQKLQEYSKELERSNAVLQQFAYVASHDLQEPLRAVAGCVQMLGERNKGKLDERSAELMGHAVDGAKRMQTLINDLLEYSRVGSKGISKKQLDPGSAVAKAVKQLQVAIAECNAEITVDPLPSIFADPVQLTQLFQNLIGNAIKFRAKRRPEIRVAAEQRDDEVIFSVRDNGIGIAPEYYGKVFGLFQRLNRRQDYSGTGIGLAICKKIVERHGGRIWIDSRIGEGADFRFTIPNEENT